MMAGAQDNKPEVEAWNPSSYEQPSLLSPYKILGVSMTASEFQEPVAVMRHGYLRGVTDGGSWVVGDLLWAEAGGTVSRTRPAGPLPQVFVGTVFQSEGGGLFTVDVDVRVIPSLGELSGVSRETPVDLDVFIFKNSTKVWEPRVLDYGSRSSLMHPFLFMGGS